VDHAWTLLSTANPAAEPASQEARDVLRFFLESFTDPQMGRGAPVGRVPSMVTLTPLYKEEVKYSAKHLSRRVDGENVSTLRFIISMMPSEWRSMLQRAKLNLPRQDYESLLDDLHNGIVGDRKTPGGDDAAAATHGGGPQAPGRNLRVGLGAVADDVPHRARHGVVRRRDSSVGARGGGPRGTKSNRSWRPSTATSCARRCTARRETRRTTRRSRTSCASTRTWPSSPRTASSSKRATTTSRKKATAEKSRGF
jgi:hypothetical protein